MQVVSFYGITCTHIHTHMYYVYIIPTSSLYMGYNTQYKCDNLANMKKSISILSLPIENSY